MIINEDDYLEHYGTPRKSGRYPWGSGGNVGTPRNPSLLDLIADMKAQGLNDTEIAKGLGMSTTEYRSQRSIARNAEKQAKIRMAQRLKEKGYSNVAIGQRMGLNESSVRALLAPSEKDKADILRITADRLKTAVEEKKFVDVGSGVEVDMGVSKDKLRSAVALLQSEGYTVHNVKIPQISTGLDTEFKVLAPPGSTQKDVWLNRYNIQQVQSFSDDGGRSSYGILPPKSVDPDRVAIKYGPDGGAAADGVVYVRPGVQDISLGGAAYAQVRVKVGDGHYIKGMAMYKDDLPDGVDLMFNTNKSDTGNKFDALKELSTDPDNPFGAVIKRQLVDRDADGNEHLTSAMNIVNEEGDWGRWSKNIASQVLSKQSPTLAKTQLDMTYENRKAEFDTIMSLTNPAVRKKLLKEFSDDADAAAVHLKAAALPRQSWHTILPVDSIPPTQIYAPNFKQGETVALIRYPHGGTFEIPELTVNNSHPPSRKLLGRAVDAVGIHPQVAERLSGADFDGDTVLVIPNGSRKIKATPALEGLKNFDHRAMYQGYPGMKVMSNTQAEMGAISNLITDMTIRGASTSDLARAVRHSMVVIDAEKHKLDYKQSALDNGIKQLKEKYQAKPEGGSGASTLISRAKSPVYLPDRKDRPASLGGPIDPVTGKRVYVETGKINYRTGQPKTKKFKALAETDDANTLSSGTRIEKVYADHSNRLKALANQARLAELQTPAIRMSRSAKKVYSNEVSSLNSKLTLAVRNRPLERQAQVIANNVVRARRAANPDMDAATLKKIKFQALQAARQRTGAKPQRIEITPLEWEAIQAGAISQHRLTEILNNADMDVVRTLATPPRQRLMSAPKIKRAQMLLDNGYTRAQVADQLGVSLSTLDEATKAQSDV